MSLNSDGSVSAWQSGSGWRVTEPEADLELALESTGKWTSVREVSDANLATLAGGGTYDGVQIADALALQKVSNEVARRANGGADVSAPFEV